MPEAAYKDPQFVLNRIYTKRGDKGETRLASGRRLPKDDLRIQAYGTVDELSAHVGVARVSTQQLALNCEGLRELSDILLRVQHELFNLGSMLATDPGREHPKQPRVTDADVEQLENEIDRMNRNLPALRSFTLPGGCRLNAELHVCRTVCRRAERSCVTLSCKEDIPDAVVRYLNRLSDAFFVWSRWVCSELGAEEVVWEPNKATSASKT